MKRTNVIIDEHVLREAQVAYGKPTMSETIDFALEELMRRHRARQILDLRGSGAWQGDLGEMRGERKRKKRK